MIRMIDCVGTCPKLEEVVGAEGIMVQQPRAFLCGSLVKIGKRCLWRERNVKQKRVDPPWPGV